jgi:hypothetical protein
MVFPDAPMVDSAACAAPKPIAHDPSGVSPCLWWARGHEKKKHQNFFGGPHQPRNALTTIYSYVAKQILCDTKY